METIPEIDPELFTYERYEMNFGDRLGLLHSMFPDIFQKNEYLEKVKRCAVGWCDPSRLAVRPRNDGIALMCEDENGEKFWFHAFEETAKALGVKTK